MIKTEFILTISKQYKAGYKSIQYQIYWSNIIRIVLQTVKIIIYKILE